MGKQDLIGPTYVRRSHRHPIVGELEFINGEKIRIYEISGMQVVDADYAFDNFRGLGEFMNGQKMLGPIDGRGYIYLWDFERFLRGGKVVD